MIDTFRPHVKVLFLRHPAHALSSLRRREAGTGAKLKSGTGTLDAKLKIFEEAFVNQHAWGFTHNVTYEEMVFAPGRGQVCMSTCTALSGHTP
jgi:hypothetical protein